MGSAFHRTKILYDGPGGEVFPSKELVEDQKIIVGKYPKRAGRLDKLLADDLGVIYMMRDPRDAMVSTHWLRPHRYWIQPKRWIQAAKWYFEHKDHPSVWLVKYEDLVRHPDEQQVILAAYFGLLPNGRFSDAWKHFDTKDETNLKNMRGARPFDPSRIGNWKKDGKKREYVERMFKHYGKKIVPLMERLGYE